MGTLGGHLAQGRQGPRPSDEENVPEEQKNKISVSLEKLFFSLKYQLQWGYVLPFKASSLLNR